MLRYFQQNWFNAKKCNQSFRLAKSKLSVLLMFNLRVNPDIYPKFLIHVKTVFREFSLRCIKVASSACCIIFISIDITGVLNPLIS